MLDINVTNRFKEIFRSFERGRIKRISLKSEIIDEIEGSLMRQMKIVKRKELKQDGIGTEFANIN